MKNSFFIKNSLYVTTAMGIAVFLITIIFWNRMPMSQRLIGIYYFLIAAHEWEEMRIPGGFVEMVISLTGMPVKDMTIPKFCLFCLTVYMMLIPFCIPSVHWLLIAALILGIIEPLVHLAVSRVRIKGNFYNPGLITSILFMVPMDIYTIYYIVTKETFAWYYWLISALLLLIPLFAAQRFIIVHLMKMNYREFIKNAIGSIAGKRKIS